MKLRVLFVLAPICLSDLKDIQEEIRDYHILERDEECVGSPVARALQEGAFALLASLKKIFDILSGFVLRKS